MSSSSDITAHTQDLPVYMLKHMIKPTPAVVDELMQFLDERMSLTEDHDIHWDLRMGNALAIICLSQHPNSLDLCGEIFTWVEDASPFLQQKIFRLIECALEPSVHHVTGRRWLRSLSMGHPLHLPVTLLVSKSGQVDSELTDIILAYWKEEPLTAGQLMGATKNEVFLQLIERELTWLAPFVRYLAFDEETSSTSIIEHDLWSVLGEAWFSINYQSRTTPAWLTPAYVMNQLNDFHDMFTRQQEWHEHLDVHLMDRFGANLPWSREDWIKKIDQSPEFSRWKNRFLEALQIHSEGKAPFRKGLRLVQPNE